MINVTAIKLPDSLNAYKNNDEENLEFLEPVSKINIFVGSNNSGKSRFMRTLSIQEGYDVVSESLEANNNKITESVERVESLFNNAGLSEVNGLSISDLNEIKSSLSTTLNTKEDKYKKVRNKIKFWANINSLSSWTGHGDPRYGNNFLGILREKANEALVAAKNIPEYTESDNFKKVYIPTLRGLRPFNDEQTDFYVERTRKDYFNHQINAKETHVQTIEREHPEIFTGLSLYQRITDLLLGNNLDRKLISKYQEFISKKLFEGKPIALIPSQKEKVIIVKIGDETEQPIHHLGDGIQSAIILTFLPFVMQEQTFFFIEEPEMYLHPGLQRKILDFYSSPECKQHTFFLTTHSNHFLDITIDIKDVSIFTFRKVFDESDEDELTPNFTIEAVDSGCESSLELLGVRNSSVFLVNATIWVEGITDRWYLREMLNSYMDFLDAKKELRMRLEEDTHYSFVEYGGANITHWSFLDYEEKPIEVKRLCAKAIVVIDEDGEKKETRKDDLQKMLGERLIILPCREVENLLPYEVIKEVVLEYEKDDSLVLKDFKYDKYQNDYLGKFIEDRMLKKDFKRKGGYKADSGTLKDKVKFCEKALSKIKYEELPESTQEIIRGIYDFIHKQNS